MTRCLSSAGRVGVLSFALAFSVHADGLVHTARCPGGGLQPEVLVDDGGTLHLLTFEGDPAAGDLLYRYLPGDTSASWSTPVNVNSRPGTAIAMGTVRGGHLAVGAGLVHVTWMSADRQSPGMLYARSDGAGGFVEPVNVSQHETALDGGGSLAVDDQGNVYVAWHAGHDGEPKRRMFVAASRDSGHTFAAEIRANPVEAGACGCCGMRAGASDDGTLWILYRAATESIHRDMQLLTSTDAGRSFAQQTVGPWELEACPMSTAAITPAGTGAVLAWETEGQIYWARAASAPADARAVDGDGGRRKHPAVATDQAGRLAVVWAEGTGWNRGGDLAWQIYDVDGSTLETGRVEGGVPVWSRAAVVSPPDGGFLILH